MSSVFHRPGRLHPVAVLLGLTVVSTGQSTMAPAILRMPGGHEVPESCVHWLEEGDHVESSSSGSGDVVVRGTTGERVELPPCPSTRSPTGDAAAAADLDRYYSDWIVDTVSVHPEIGSFVTNWTVPKAPTSRGPVPGMSSAYIFNGLEDGAGKSGAATMILQPVLSYGKSGCVLNPLAGWRFTAFQVTLAGRAYCGKSLPVEEGDRLQGRMELVGKDVWKVTADAGSKGRSEHTVSAAFRANAAYLTLEGMVIYSCAALPGEGVAFSDNRLADSTGGAISPNWRTEVMHSECSPNAKVNGGAVEMTWASSSIVTV